MKVDIWKVKSLLKSYLTREKYKLYVTLMIIIKRTNNHGGTQPTLVSRDEITL